MHILMQLFSLNVCFLKLYLNVFISVVYCLLIFNGQYYLRKGTLCLFITTKLPEVKTLLSI